MTNERFDLVVKDELGVWNKGAEEEKNKASKIFTNVNLVLKKGGKVSTSRQTPTMKTMESGSWNK